VKSLLAALAFVTCFGLVSGCMSPADSSPTDFKSYLGVFEPGVPQSYQPIDRFASLIGKQPDIVLYYSGWPERFRTSFADEATAHGATVLVQIDPTDINLAALAAGQYDSYITWYAKQVRAYGHRVIIGFGHEMNGSWYSWAWQHTAPQLWIAAWRHMVEVFRAADATNVTWMWTITRNAPSTGPIQDWWPGAAYVNWVGIDGYYYTRKDDFKSVFSSTIADVRKITDKPILLSEVGIGQISGQAKNIPGLFAGVKHDHLLGLVWFDVAQHGSMFAQDWRLEGHRAAVNAFRQGAAGLDVPTS
jgi:mannan endo-1,4-beta-mannosidase